MTYRSDEEKFYSWWLDELAGGGFVDSYEYEGESFVLTEPATHRYVKETVLKTKVKREEKEQVILSERTYTPDFKIIWNEKANKLFFTVLEESAGEQIRTPFLAHREGGPAYSFIEVKGSFDRNGSIRIFRDNVMKFLYATQKIFVNLVIVPKIFEQTFTPEKFLYTEKKQQLKKLKFKPMKLEDYVN